MRLKQARTANTLRSFTPVRTAVLARRGTFEIGFPAPTTQVSKCRGPIKSSGLKKLAAPQGFEPRYADPESAFLPLNEGAVLACGIGSYPTPILGAVPMAVNTRAAKQGDLGLSSGSSQPMFRGGHSVQQVRWLPSSSPLRTETL